MITQSPQVKEEPFSFVRPQLPARPFSDGKELEENPDTLLPAAQAYTYTDGLLQHGTSEAERLGKDANLTTQGRRVAFTEQVVKPGLTELRKHLAALDAAGEAIQREAAEAQQTTAPPSPSDGQRAERSAIAAAFGSK